MKIDAELEKDLNDREVREDILWAGTVEKSKATSMEIELVQCIWSHFEFSDGGYNGWFNTRTEMFEEIQNIVKNWS